MTARGPGTRRRAVGWIVSLAVAALAAWSLEAQEVAERAPAPRPVVVGSIDLTGVGYDVGARRRPWWW